MTPAEIAAKMTPAQVRALRNPWKCRRADFGELINLELSLHAIGERLIGKGQLTPLGQAVLAALDEGAA